MNIRRSVAKAQDEGTLIRIIRADLEAGSIDGVVVGVGPEWFAMEIVDSFIRINGVICLRFEDISECKIPCPTAAFQTKALEMRGEEFQRSHDIDLSSLPNILISSAKSFPVVTIHTELEDPDVCYIGRVESVNRGKLELLEITINGSWESETDSYSLDSITRVDFGGQYEKALVMVANAG